MTKTESILISMLSQGSNGDQILKILDSLTNDQPEAESATMTPSLEPIDF